MYSQQQGAAAGGQPQPERGGAGSAGRPQDDDVVDADFREVKGS